MSDARKEFPAVKFIDTCENFFDGDYCHATIDERFLCRNDTHLYIDGAHYFAGNAAKHS